MPEGKMTLLSTTALQRMADAPDLPTLDEQGAKGYDAPVLYSIIAPKGTSTAVIEALNQSMNSAVESAEFRQRIRPLGAVPAKPVNPAAGVIHLHPPGATSHGRAALSFAGHVRVTAGRCWRSGRAPAHLRKSG
jgi:hypothetical protein